MKFLRSLLVCLVALPMLAQAATVNQNNPYTMMEQVSNALFSRLKAEQKQIHSDPETLRVIVKQELLPYINVGYAAYSVLGTATLKKMSKEQRVAFVDAFSNYLVTSYAQVLTQYSDQKIQIQPESAVPAGRSIISVRVDILDSQRPPIRLDFKLRLNKKTEKWQGFDMVAEGISMLSTNKSEWRGPLRTQGVDAVTNKLRELAAKPIRFETSQ